MDYPMLHVRPGRPFYQYDWKERQFSTLEFAQDFMLSFAHARMTTGLSFFAEDGLRGSGIVVTRSGVGRLSDRELSTFLALASQFRNLYNLHRRIQRLANDHICAAELARGHDLLSRREAQVTELLCKRL
jgi:hypothetical protein